MTKLLKVPRAMPLFSSAVPNGQTVNSGLT